MCNVYGQKEHLPLGHKQQVKYQQEKKKKSNTHLFYFSLLPSSFGSSSSCS